MIRTTLPELIILYLMVFLAAIFLVWVIYEMVRRIVDRPRQQIVKCAVCGLGYCDESASPLPRCPGCGSLNERRKVKTY